MKRLKILIFLSILSIPTFAQDWESVEIKTVEVADKIYMLQGRGGNIGVIAGDDGVLIVDDQYAPLVPKIKAAIAALSDKEVRYVVNTHYHGDHMGGNEVFGESGSIIIAHENVRERISTDQLMVHMQRPVPARPEAAWPVITFTEDVTFYFNDEEIWIHKGPSAHTDGDAVVWFKKANVIHMGDTFVRYGYPFIDVSGGGSVTGMIDHLEQVLNMIDNETKVIPGHGELATKSDIVTFKNVISDIRDSVAAAVEQGDGLDEILSSGITEKYDEQWQGDFIKAKDFITFTYEDLIKK
ncbi:MAG: MBL fold metallo-hydrolase [Cyclobacteriaceae bacterium]